MVPNKVSWYDCGITISWYNYKDDMVRHYGAM